MVVAASPMPVAPRPHPDELISSWLGRTAAVYDMDVDRLLARLLRNGDVAPGGVDLELAPDERDRIAEAFGLAPGCVAALELAQVWPNLAGDWLRHVNRARDAPNPLLLCWCPTCLEEGRRAGGPYLDHETALPLVLCHRHLRWRYESCRNCVPTRRPAFMYINGATELICPDCRKLLQTIVHRVPVSEWSSDDRRGARQFEMLLAFEKCLRGAWLGHSSHWFGVGEVQPSEFLALLDDLTKALLARNLDQTSLINRFQSEFIGAVPHHRPRSWADASFTKLSPRWRAKVLCAVIAIISREEISVLFSLWYWTRSSGSEIKTQKLEWLFENATTRVQAMLIRGSERWPAALRDRMRVLHAASGIDVDDVLARFEAIKAELGFTSLIRRPGDPGWRGSLADLPT